ncbi:type II-A CRISPR-associated protein Csn2 [Lapidilactobacillus dextrinicus]|uniref:type II-A CRISPR-associated protein Csn2 n=1 Tax=Lapidilactobacillus dextrinicus TaxID=51664 RepID=UPI003F212411
MANIIKLCNISFINTLKTQPYDIIETVLKCASELNERSILVLTNVHQYLSVSQFQELVRLIETLDLSTLLIEFSEKKKSDYYENCRYYYIDQDFIDWRQE